VDLLRQRLDRLTDHQEPPSERRNRWLVSALEGSLIHSSGRSLDTIDRVAHILEPFRLRAGHFGQEKLEDPNGIALEISTQ
jgi:hypothetical protein